MASTPAARPAGPRQRQGLVLPWAFALVLGVLVAIFAPMNALWGWHIAAAGLCVIVTFIVQLRVARADGFILRTATASLGCILILGLVSLVGALFTAVAAGLSIFPAAG